MTKRLIIHIGPHKTGTTAIQKMLHDNSRNQASSFTYPFTDSDRMGQHAFAETIYNSDYKGLNALVSELEKSDKPCVLSSEEFCYLPHDTLKNFKSILGRFNVTIVYYARNCLTTLHPWWQEQVKHGSSQTFIEFALALLIQPNNIHLFTPDAMLSNWADAFGKDAIKLFIYDDIADVATQFIVDLLEIVPAHSNISKTNKSYDYVETEMMRFWNHIGARGADLIQSPLIHKISGDIANAAQKSSKRFKLGYDIPSLAAIEATLLDRWGDRIVGSLDPHIFKTRERSYSYLHPDFWVMHSDLAERMNAFAFG